MDLTHAVKVTLTICRSFRFHRSKSWSLSTAGSRPGGILHTQAQRQSHTHTQWDFTLTFDMLRNQRWSYTYFKLKLFQWMSFWGIIRALFVKTDLFKDANPLKKTPKATSWRYMFCTDLKQFILLTPSPILVNKRLNLFAQSFEFLFSVSHNS